MKKKFLLSLITSAAMLFSTAGFSVSAEENIDMRDITTMELVRDMGLGINLGNTLESCGEWIGKYGDGSVQSYETAWGSPVITQDMIRGYADEGFGVLRVPVAWSNLMGDNYTISSEYLARVRQIVDWATSDGLYVILNIHYDGGWFEKFSTDKITCMAKYTRIWEQLTEAFKDYNDYLMFESLNEEGCWNDLWNRWSGSTDGKQTAYDLLNEINQKFVDIVRSSGGNNSKRHLLIAGYATDIDLTCDSMYKMPNDPENRCAVSVHYYTPSDFAILEKDEDWGKMRTTWGTDEDFKQLEHYMDMMKTNFIDKGIPVIVGEYGSTKTNKDADSVKLFLKSVCGEAYERQLCPVLWDITGLHYDRSTCKLVDTQLKADFAEILSSETENIIGDLNEDKAVSAADAVILQKYLLKQSELTGEQMISADCCSDNKINCFDMIILKRIIIRA